MSEIRFAKFHGTGNDFIMLEDLDDRHPLAPALVAALCHRRFGVGADGLIRVTRAEGADFFMDYRNADGSPAEMCGNGIRCLGKLVFDRGLTDRTELDVMTRDGKKHLHLEVGDGKVRSVTVGMGRADFARGAIPMSGPAEESFLEQPLDAAGRTWTASAVSMGNPHVVLFVDDDPAALDVHGVGVAVGSDLRFPEGANVEFVQRADAGLRARVWERGVGETMACGTGACAVFVAASRAGLVPRRGIVRFPGGTLGVEWVEEGEVLLTGPAERVFEASLDPAWLEERSRGEA